MSHTGNKFLSLLHLISKDDLDGLNKDTISDFKSNWVESWQNHTLDPRYKFETKEELELAINELTDFLEEHKLVFNNKALLSYLEEDTVHSDLEATIIRLKEEWENPWLSRIIQEALSNGIINRTREVGVKNIQEIKILSEAIHHMPILVQDKVEKVIRRALKSFISDFDSAVVSGNTEVASSFVSAHFKNAINAMPFETDDILHGYGRVCEKLVSKNLLQSDKSSQTSDERQTFAKAASLAGEILKDGDLRKIARQASLLEEQKSSGSGGLIKVAGGSIIVLLIAFAGYKMYGFFQNETSTYDERYAKYVEERNEFKLNRQFSQASIEQRNVTEIIESFQYGERENVPLFHTYIKTNKYLDINEIDKEIFQLKKLINTDGIETDNIFAKVFFFLNEKDNSYREVLAEFSNIQRQAKYKQVIKTRATSNFTINSRKENPYKVVIEVEESYPSGVIEMIIYEIHFQPKSDKLYVYYYDPMPALIDSLTIGEYESKNMASDNQDDHTLGMLRLVTEILDGVIFKYRIPYYPTEVRYDMEADPIVPMYNWELTTSDDLAFIRIRSDDVNGYYLVDREAGYIVQAKAGFKTNRGVKRTYFMHFDELEKE